MELRDIKKKILDKSISNKMIIFIDPEKFISKQYIQEIAAIRNKNIQYVEDSFLIDSDSNIFDDSDDGSIKVIITKNFDKTLYQDNTYIICDSVSSDINKDFVVEVPKLEPWQIQDYIYTRCQGVEKKDLDTILKLCDYNIYRIENEINKIVLFPEMTRKYAVKQFFSDNIFSDLCEYNIFSLSNALISKDKDSLRDILNKIDNMDINPIGFVTVLYNNFKNIINIQLNPNASAESLHMNPKQFAALKYRINKYSGNQLVSIFNLLTDIDYKLKSGYLPASNILDYVILKILSF